jgi:hypothetical protein
MSKPAAPAHPTPAKAALAEQKSDFTAEGAPPPGQVSAPTPLPGHDPAHSLPNRKAPADPVAKAGHAGRRA